MSFHAYRATAFSHTHENKAFDKLYDLLKAQWAEPVGWGEARTPTNHYK